MAVELIDKPLCDISETSPLCYRKEIMKLIILILTLMLINNGCKQNIKSTKKVNKSFEVIYSYETKKSKRIIKELTFEISGNENFASDSENKLIIKDFKNSKPTELILDESFVFESDNFKHQFGKYQMRSKKGLEFNKKELVAFYTKQNGEIINFYIEIKER